MLQNTHCQLMHTRETCIYMYTYMYMYVYTYVCTCTCIFASPHSIPAPCHVQTGSRPGTLSERTPDETEWTADQLSDAQSPAKYKTHAQSYKYTMYTYMYMHMCVLMPSNHTYMYVKYAHEIHVHVHVYTCTCVYVIHVVQ